MVASGVDIERFLPLPDASEAEVFYVGSFRHLPIIIGSKNSVCDAVWRKFASARLRVVAGPEPERYWREAMHRDYPGIWIRVSGSRLRRGSAPALSAGRRRGSARSIGRTNIK
jgi:hypothetical protein